MASLLIQFACCWGQSVLVEVLPEGKFYPTGTSPAAGTPGSLSQHDWLSVSGSQFALHVCLELLPW